MPVSRCNVRFGFLDWVTHLQRANGATGRFFLRLSSNVAALRAKFAYGIVSYAHVHIDSLDDRALSRPADRRKWHSGRRRGHVRNIDQGCHTSLSGCVRHRQWSARSKATFDTARRRRGRHVHCYGGCPGPWTYRNYQVTGGRFVLLTPGASDSFLRGYVFTRWEFATLRKPPYIDAENESNNWFRKIASDAGTLWDRTRSLMRKTTHVLPSI